MHLHILDCHYEYMQRPKHDPKENQKTKKTIDRDLVEVVNKAIGKSWVTPRSSIIDISAGDFYYK